ncbi:MAG: hypothetical protein KAQ85_09060 [Thermodesulfovibrionia bacterium]|nr:hypothetical protein [Thermodesulfovibrionia bacterium]
MNKFFIPAHNPEDWKWLLSKPDRHWRKGSSARALAHCWHEAKCIPEDVISIFKKSGIPVFQNIEMLLAFPEFKTPLPPYTLRPSENDIFVLARGNNQLISTMVYGKVSEPFGQTVQEWLHNHGKGKEKRLDFLRNYLQLKDKDINNIKYQLLHRTASAIITAKNFNAENALLLVHSFSRLDKGFRDFKKLTSLFGIKGKVNAVTGPQDIKEVSLFFCWVRGDRAYLEK